MTTISLDAAVNAVLGDEATARHWAVLGKQCRDPDARVARCREARALLREQRVSQGDNVKALCELRPSGATLWRWIQLAETAHAQLLAKRARGDDDDAVRAPPAAASPTSEGSSMTLQLGREARGHRRVVRPRARHALPGTPHAADGFRINAGAASDGDATK